MSEAESRSPDRTSFDNSNITTKTKNSITFVTSRKEEALKNPDLQNSTSDYDESESEREDESEQEISEQTCSRARPYVRGRKLSGPTFSPPISSSRVKTETSNISNLSVPMPTPPDEPDALITTTFIPKYATPIETPDDKGNLDTSIIPESSKTELQSNTTTATIICDDIKGSPVQTRDSVSEGNESETSAKPISIDPENSSETSPKLQQKRIPQLSEDVKTITSKSVSCHKSSNLGNTGSRKGSKIPVGIAVAWQRLVTSMSTVASLTTSVTSAPSVPKDTTGNYHQLSELPCSPPPIKIPLRPSSASSITPIKITSAGKEDKVKRSGNGCGDSVHTKKGHNNISRNAIDRKSYTPELNSISAPSRPLPSSSVPPNLGLGYLQGSLMEYHYGMRSSTPYPSLSNPHQEHGILPPSWPQTSAADLSVSQGFNSPGAAAAYLQQTMHNQMQLQQQLQTHHHSYSNYPHPSASYLHPGFETFRQQYEQLILHNHQQQQHSELLRQYHQHHQQQQYQQLLSSNGYDSQRATPTLPPSGSPRQSIPILSPSPTGGVRTPTPTTKLNPSHHSLSLSNLSTAGVPNWPAELYHHNSSIALSPKSLTSSSPSPVTVQHDFSPTPLNLVSSIGSGGGGGGSAFLGRKSASPNPISNNRFPLSPSPITSSRKYLGKDVQSSQISAKHLSTLADENANEKDRKNSENAVEDYLKPKSNGKLEHDGSDDEHFADNKKYDMPLSHIGQHQSSSQLRHDFTRMESLIEKRVQESVQPLNQEEEIEASEQKDANAVDKGHENMSKDDMKNLVKVETDLNPKFQPLDKIYEDEFLQPSPSSPKMIKSETNQNITTTSLTQQPSVKCKNARKPKSDKLGKLKTDVKQKKVRGESKPLLQKVPKVSKIPKNSTGSDFDKPKSPKKKYSRQSGNKSVSPVRNPKKPNELGTHRKKSDGFVQKNKKREDYNINIGNVVPDSTIPVASYMSTTISVSDNHRDKPNLKVGLSQESTAEKAVLNSNGTVVLLTGVPRDSDDICMKTKSCTAPGKVESYFTSGNGGLKAENPPSSSSSSYISSVSCGSNANPDNNPLSRIGEDETKYNKNYSNSLSNNNIYASQSNMTSDHQRDRDSSTPSTATLIITNQNQPISLCGGNTISLNPVTISPGRVSIISNPGPNTGVQSSPVTLFLPRILPQGPINSHHQTTSFKLVLSSQEIKIPAFVPSSTDGTVKFYQQQQLQPQFQQSYSTTASLQNLNVDMGVSSPALAATTASTSSFLVTPCDSETISSNRNTISTVDNPITPQYFPSTLPIRQTILPNPTSSLQSSYVDPIQQSNIFIGKDFIEQGENHLNLLATVAQEFGTRDDLGKLKISTTSSSTSTTFISSIATDNFHPDVQTSIREEMSIPTQPIVSMQSPEILYSLPPSSAALSSASALPACSVPPIIQPTKSKHSASRSSYDEYEYDEKEHTGTETSSGSYKQAVWLKIPQVIPKAATKVAEKLLKAQRKQEKVLTKVASKKPKTPKKKRDNLSIVAESVKNRGDNDNTQTKSKVKPITQRAKGSPKKSLHKMETKINETDTLSISKLKIPKLPESLIKLPTKQKESRSRSRSPEKSEMQSKKTETKATEHYNTHTKEPISMKMTLPIPKVAKIRIKLSETEEPTLLRHNSADVSPYPKISNDGRSFPNDKKKEKIKRRHSDGDKLSPKKKHRHNHHSQSQSQEDKSISPTSDLNRNKSHNKRRKRNHEQGHGNQNPHPTKDSKVIKRKGLDNIVSETSTKSRAADLSRSFTSLTPPPTAKLLFEMGSPRSLQGVCHPIFSPSNLENETETENENDFSWVADPTFAVSAIRSTTNHSPKGPAGHSRDDATSGEFSRKSEKKDKRKSCKPSKLSLQNLRNQTQQMDTDKDLKSQLKSFVHFAPKRVISESKSQPRPHHIKPRLKAEPIVRPLSSFSGEEEEDSDAEIDLEVATLTKSIPPTHKSSFYQPNLKKSQHQQAISNSNPIKNTSQSFSKTKTIKRSSSSHSSKAKNFSRRLSLNLDRNRINEVVHETSDEELPDIDEGYTASSYLLLQNPSQSTSGQSSVTENKQISNNNHIIKESGSGYGSSSSWQPKRLPKKRSSRSSTATSTASEKPATLFGLSRLLSSGESSSTTVPSDILEDETLLPGKIELESVTELLDEMRILTEIQGLFYTGKLNALQPPDVYGVTLDNERGAPPHLIFSAEEVLEKCIREKKPKSLTVTLRICAYWSPQYSGLYPGRVSTDFNPHFDPEKDLIPIEFDDGDTGMIKLGEIRLLPANHPIRAYDPNPLLTLEKKHRKRRHSSTNNSSGPCTGDHEEADCGESFCAKVGKYEEDDDELKDTHHPFKSLYWTWTGLGYKRPKSKKNRHKEFFRGIQRGDEVINVGDSAIFISHGNERPYIGRVEKFWEKKGQKVVNVRWFYHPEEVKSPRRVPHLKHPGALFESPHIDENDVQTIAKKCDVLPFTEFKERIGRMPKLSLKNSTPSKPRDLYYIGGYYDPYTYNLQLKI